MSHPTLEERISLLEQEVAELKAHLPPADGFKDWRQAVGMFPHDALMKQIDAAGQAIREAERRRARHRRPKTLRTKK